MNRKQRRAAARVAKRSGNEELQEKLEALSHIKEECFVCQIPFDKTDMKMLDSWIIVVNKAFSTGTRLYCPTCWEEAMEFVKSSSM
jgi:hypothetical protein